MLLIEIFAIPAVLAEPGGIHVLSVRIWELVGFTPPKVNEASALGVLLLLVTVTLVLLQDRVLARRSFITVSGKGQRRQQSAWASGAGRSARWASATCWSPWCCRSSRCC